MRIGVWIEDVDLSVGGGASYHNKLILAINEYAFDEKLDIKFILSKPNTFQFKKETIIVNDRLQWIERIKIRFQKFVMSIVRTDLVFNLKGAKYKIIARRIDQQLRQHQIDLVFYPFQLKIRTSEIPFVATNWDLGHLTMYPFPEVTNKGEFEKRQDYYNTLSKAFAVFVESESGKQELCYYLRFNPQRVFVIPIFAGGVVELNVPIENQQESLLKLGIEKNKYFFYPAQFWAHKNHYNLLIAFRKFQSTHRDFKLVLTGSDKGNLKYIQDLIDKFSLRQNVVYAGFVTDEVLYTLYRNACSLVMPTFLGPTNMPLLEASEIGCPIICSDFEGHREMLGSGAQYVTPENSGQILDAMTSMTDPIFRNKLLESAQQQRKNEVFTIRTSIKLLNDYFLYLKNIRATWGNGSY